MPCHCVQASIIQHSSTPTPSLLYVRSSKTSSDTLFFDSLRIVRYVVLMAQYTFNKMFPKCMGHEYDVGSFASLSLLEDVWTGRV